MSNNNTEEEVKTTTTTNNNDDDDDDDAAVTTSSSCPPHSNWSKDKLTGKSVSFKGLPVGGSDNSGNSGGPTSLLKRRSSKQAMAATPMEDGIHPQLWGRPGHLTDAEADVYSPVGICFTFLP